MEPEVALRVVAPRIFQCVGDVLGLHTLCGDHASEVVAETDERTHDGAILLVARQVGEERPVDLDLRHVGGAELGQVREVHSEVVHGYWMPWSASGPTTALASSASNANAVSLTSRWSRSGGTPASCRIWPTLPANSGDVRFRAETLTATVQSWPAAVQAV